MYYAGLDKKEKWPITHLPNYRYPIPIPNTIIENTINDYN